jgi:hypothetical protein
MKRLALFVFFFALLTLPILASCWLLNVVTTNISTIEDALMSIFRWAFEHLTLIAVVVVGLFVCMIASDWAYQVSEGAINSDLDEWLYNHFVKPRVSTSLDHKSPSEDKGN